MRASSNAITTTATDNDPVPLSYSESERLQGGILVVEDSAAERARVVVMLKKQGHEVIEAANGKEALEKVNAHSVAVIVTDWHMPKMDGLTLCKTIKETVTAPPYILILTGRTSKCELVAAMDNGADDYLCKPFNGEELRVRILAGLRLNQMGEALAQKNAALQAALYRETKLNGIMQQSLSAAEKLQRSALPVKHASINGIGVAHYLKPAQGVAGDIYSILPLGETHVAFFHVDVAGHGMRAAMLSYAIARHLSELIKRFQPSADGLNMLSPAAVLNALNEDFACDDDCSDYFTLVYGALEVATGQGKLSQAGHPHPFIVGQDGKTTKLGKGGMPVGLFSDAQFEECEFLLAKKARLVLYSDGLWECKIGDGVNFNENMLIQVLGALNNLPMAKLQAQLDKVLDRLAGGTSPKDDMSFFVLERCKHD